MNESAPAISLAEKNAAELVPRDYFAPLPLAEIFLRTAPLHVDVGAGAGAFLLAMARRFPEQNFLGLERLAGRVRKTCGMASRQGLTNVRVLRIESAYAVRHLLPAGSVNVFHISFPDPWPKRRHWPRRLVNVEFFHALTAALAPAGEVRIKTDDAPYFAQIKTLAAQNPAWQEIAWPHDPEYPITNFERHFFAREIPIHHLRLVKV